MNHEALTRALLSDVYKMTDTEIEAILSNTDETAALTQIQEADKVRVSNLQKPKPGSTFQDGYAKAKKEEREAVEAKLKSAFEINDEDKAIANLDDLISAIVEKKGHEVNSPDISKMSVEDIKKIPAFQTLQRQFNQQLTQVKTEAENRIKEIESNNARKETFSSVAKLALSTLDTLNPVLPQNAKAAEKQKASYLKELESYDWQEDNGDFIAVDKEGKTIDDGKGNAIRASELAKAKAGEWFDFAANNGGANGGNGKAGDNTASSNTAGYPAGITKPKTFEELNAIVGNPDLKPEDRRTVLETWKAENPNTVN